MPTHPWFGPYQQQLELFENDPAYQADDEDEKPKEPSPESGYLTCKICLDINHYKFPQKDYICRGCKMFHEWLVKK